METCGNCKFICNTIDGDPCRGCREKDGDRPKNWWPSSAEAITPDWFQDYVKRKDLGETDLDAVMRHTAAGLSLIASGLIGFLDMSKNHLELNEHKKELLKFNLAATLTFIANAASQIDVPLSEVMKTWVDVTQEGAK